MHARGNVKACCIVFVSSDFDKMTVARRHWMQTLKELVEEMKEANLVFHFYQLKEYIKKCEEFHHSVNKYSEKRVKLENDGYSADYYHDEENKTRKALRKLRMAIYEQYFRGCRDDQFKDKPDDPGLEKDLLEKLHSMHKGCRAARRELVGNGEYSTENECPMQKWPNRGDIDNDMDNFRIRNFDSLPKFHVLLGCKSSHILKSVAQHAKIFDTRCEMFYIDNNDTEFGKFKGRKPERHEMRKANIEREGFAFGSVVYSLFANHLAMVKHEKRHPTISRSRFGSVCSSSFAGGNISSSIGTNSLKGSSSDLFTAETCGSLDNGSCTSGSHLTALDSDQVNNQSKSESNLALNWTPVEPTPEENSQENYVAYRRPKIIKQNSVDPKLLQLQPNLPAEVPVILNNNKPKKGNRASRSVERKPETKQSNIKTLKPCNHVSQGKRLCHTVGKKLSKISVSDKRFAEKLHKQPGDLRVLVCCALIGQPVCLTEEESGGNNEMLPSGQLQQLLDFFVSFLPNAADKNFFWLNENVDKGRKAVYNFFVDNSGKGKNSQE